MAKRPGFMTFHSDLRVLLDGLDVVDFYKLAKLALEFSENGTIPAELSGELRFAFSLVRSRIVEDVERYNEICRKNAENAKGRKRPSATAYDGERPQTVAANSMQSNSTATQVNADDSNSMGEGFAPPTADDVKAYCAEEGLKIDAERFVDYYASKGWVVGKAPMKDWRAAVRNWAKGDDKPTTAKPGKTVHEQQYAQREYDDDDSELQKQIAEWKARQSDGHF